MSWTPAKLPSATHLPSGSHALGWLAGDTKGALVLETVHQLMAAQTYVEQALPPALGKLCKVARIDRQQMLLAVPSAAHASKLRQLAPSVMRRVNAAGWNINEVQVQVQAHLFQNVSNIATRSVQPLDEQALNAFENLHNQLQPGPLAQAIENLLRNHQHKR